MIPKNLVKDYLDGKITIRDLASKMGMSTSTMYKKMRMEGIKSNKRKRIYKKLVLPDTVVTAFLSGKVKLSELCRRFDKSSGTIRSAIADNPKFHKFVKAGKDVRSLQQKEHRLRMVEMWRAGATLAEVGMKFGLTRERVRQYVNMIHPNLPIGYRLIDCCRCNREMICTFRGGKVHFPKKNRAVICPDCWEKERAACCQK